MDNKTAKGSSEFYDYKDVSRLLDVSERSARIIMVQHEFPSFKIGQKVLVRIKDFNIWFESLVGKDIPLDPNVNKFKTPKKGKRRREEVTNYFGKARLKKIFYSYISDRPKLAKAIRTDGRLYYEKFRGFEWLTCYYEDYYFKISAEGKKTKVITLDEYRYNEIKDKDERFNRVFSYYSEDFRPNPKNKDKSLDCYDVAKKISENAEVRSQA